MTTKFGILFIVAIEHSYYSTSSKDFDFHIPSDTRQVFRNGKLLAKERNGKLYVLYEADEAGAAVSPLAGNTLRIGLKLINPYFSNFTSIVQPLDSSTPLYRNAGNPITLGEPETVRLVGRVFSHPLTEAARPVTAILKNADGQLIQEDTITDESNRPTLFLDLTGQAAGSYTVEETYPGETETVMYYSDAELQQHQAFGIIEIKIENNFYASAPEFKITFTAKEETLKYYVVASNYSDTEFNQLEVKDRGFNEDKRPELIFETVASIDFADDDIPPALLGGDNVKVALFKSQAVARRKNGRKKIQLSKNGEVLVTHLPQPGADKAVSDIIINISKPEG